VQLYEKLYPELATDYQFLHQFAKGYLMYAYKLPYDKMKDKLNALKSASEKIEIAKSLVTREVYKKQTFMGNIENNQITLSHMNFTKSIIDCEICLLEKFNNLELLDAAIQELFEASNSPYNYNNIQDSYYSDDNKTVSDFLNHCAEINLNNIQRERVNFIRNTIKND
jgi:hypothetical protein